MENNEINKICLHYKSNHEDKGKEYCDLKNKYFELTDNKLEPNCYKCVSDIEKLLSVMV